MSWMPRCVAQQRPKKWSKRLLTPRSPTTTAHASAVCTSGMLATTPCRLERQLYQTHEQRLPPYGVSPGVEHCVRVTITVTAQGNFPFAGTTPGVVFTAPNNTLTHTHTPSLINRGRTQLLESCRVAKAAWEVFRTSLVQPVNTRSTSHAGDWRRKLAAANGLFTATTCTAKTFSAGKGCQACQKQAPAAEAHVTL